MKNHDHVFVLIFLCTCMFADTFNFGNSKQNCTLVCGKSDTDKSDPIVVVRDKVNITVYHNTKKPNGIVDCIITAKREPYHEEDKRSTTSGIVT